MEPRQQKEYQSTELSQFQDFHCPKVQFLWVQQCSSVLRKLSFNINREICSYLGDFIPQVLPGIYEDKLQLYDLHGGETKQVTLSQSFSAGTMYCVIDDQTVLCIGGSPEVTDMYALSLSNYQLSQLPSMSVARGWSGILRHRDHIYVFGGNWPIIVQCEKYSLTSRSWRTLPNMSYPRRAFSPSEYHGEVYLPEPYEQHKVLETFNLGSETFKTLPLSLVSFTDEFGVSFILDGELIIITSIQIGRYRIQSTETNFSISQISSTGVLHIVSNCPPVLVGRELHFVIYDSGKLMKFNVDSQIVR